MEVLRSVNLAALKQGAELRIGAGQETNAFTYQVRIIEPGTHPVCDISIKDSSGQITAQSPRAILEGTGNWTTQAQNPVQKQWGKAMTIAHGMLHVGGLLIVHEEGPANRKRAILEPACTEIEIL